MRVSSRLRLAESRVRTPSHITPEEIFEGSRVVAHNRSLRSLSLEHEGVVPVSCPKTIWILLPGLAVSARPVSSAALCSPSPSRGHLWLPTQLRALAVVRPCGATPKFRGSSVMTLRAAALCQAGIDYHVVTSDR